MGDLQSHLRSNLLLTGAVALVGAALAVGLAPFSALGAIAAGALPTIGFVAWSSVQAMRLFSSGVHPFQRELEETEPEPIVARADLDALKCLCVDCGRGEPYRIPKNWIWGDQTESGPVFPLCPQCAPKHPLQQEAGSWDAPKPEECEMVVFCDGCGAEGVYRPPEGWDFGAEFIGPDGQPRPGIPYCPDCQGRGTKEP